jgi:hypothetical protein
MRTIDLSGPRMAAWWIKSGRGWVEALESLTANGIRLDQEALKDYAARLVDVSERQGTLQETIMEEQLAAALGRKHLELEQLNRNYDQLLVLLANVVSGEIGPARVTVDLAARTWALAEKPVAPSE